MAKSVVLGRVLARAASRDSCESVISLYALPEPCLVTGAARNQERGRKEGRTKRKERKRGRRKERKGEGRTLRMFNLFGNQIPASNSRASPAMSHLGTIPHLFAGVNSERKAHAPLRGEESSSANKSIGKHSHKDKKLETCGCVIGGRAEMENLITGVSGHQFITAARGPG